MADNDGSALIEDTKLVLKNFRGEEQRYNKAGDRNFGVVLPVDMVQEMVAAGWNVKQFKPHESDDPETEPDFWLPVKVGWGKGKPPTIWIVTSRGRTQIGEDRVEMLDWADIIKADVIVRPYNWTNANQESGVTAWLKTMFVHIQEDPLEAKYADVPAQ